MRQEPAPHDFDGWVAQLRFPSTRQRARLHLLESGPPAVPALRRGLRHAHATVRQQCVRIFDRLLDDRSVPALVDALDDEDPTVCGRALHSLACDTCKEGECRPGEDLWVPKALALLADLNPDLRAAAIDALGTVVWHRPDVATALASVAAADPDKGLRGMARRHAGAA